MIIEHKQMALAGVIERCWRMYSEALCAGDIDTADDVYENMLPKAYDKYEQEMGYPYGGWKHD